MSKPYIALDGERAVYGQANASQTPNSFSSASSAASRATASPDPRAVQSEARGLTFSHSLNVS